MSDFELPLITAHTGCMGLPDNSLESAAAALAHGADIVEDDIRVTRDGVLVLSHDEEVPLPGGLSARLGTLDYRELGERTARPPAELERLLLLVKESGARMNLDVKEDEALEPLARLVARLGMEDRVFLTGCEYGRAMRAGRAAPSLPRLLNVHTPSFMLLGAGEASRQACEEASETDCFGLNVPYPLVSDELLERAADAGLPLYVWTVNEPGRMRRCLDWGVRSVTTRDVAALAAAKADWLRSRGRTAP